MLFRSSKRVLLVFLRGRLYFRKTLAITRGIAGLASPGSVVRHASFFFQAAMDMGPPLHLIPAPSSSSTHFSVNLFLLSSLASLASAQRPRHHHGLPWLLSTGAAATAATKRLPRPAIRRRLRQIQYAGVASAVVQRRPQAAGRRQCANPVRRRCCEAIASRSSAVLQ